MEPDRYTEVVLTVMAACLIWLCVDGLTPAATAQAEVQRVVLVGLEKPLRGLPVIPVNEAGESVLDGSALRVLVANPTSRPIPTGIVLIERRGALHVVPSSPTTAEPAQDQK